MDIAKKFKAGYLEAAEAGDLDRLRTLHHEEMSYGTTICRKGLFTVCMLEAVCNAAISNPDKLQRDILCRILSLQYSLLDRVDIAIRDQIIDHDQRGYAKNEIPECVATELLPRYGKITSEIFLTMKMLKKIADPPTPGAKEVRKPAQDDPGDA